MNRAFLGGAVVLVLSTLGVSYWAFFVRPEHKTEEAKPVAPETLVVTAQSGHVEIAGADGAWRPAQPGTSLSAHDRIRTDDDGEASLRATDGSIVKLYPASEAHVAELRRELKRLHLGAGMVEAEVAESSDRVFELELDENGGVARTKGGSFTATSNGAGTAAVASRRGEVVLSARGREVVLRTGQWARIKPGEAPEQPQPLPSSLFLKVAWPDKALRSHKIEITGSTTPGARVSVEGKWVQVGADGRYQRTVSLPDGPHQLRVKAVDVSGHVSDEKSPRIVVDTKTDFSVQAPKWK
jgi:FecR protein